VNCDPSALTRAAAALGRIPEGLQPYVATYLLAIIAGQTTDPAKLMALAKCMGCIPPGDQQEVQDYLLCQIANATGGTPAPPTYLVSPLMTNWVARVVTNLGATPSANTQTAVNAFALGLDAAGLLPKMIAVNCFAPDNLSACTTPLIKNFGNDPWTNHNFAVGALTVNGLAGNGSSSYLDTGVVPNNCFPNVNSAGITLYSTKGNADAGKNDASVITGAANAFQIQTDELGQTIFDCFTNNTGARVICPALPGSLGYTSANRTDATHQSVYQANSLVPHYLAGTNAGGPGASMPAGILPIFCWNSIGGTGITNFSNKRFSFAAIHLGLTQAESLALYTLVQAMRFSFGGGYV
jgi:hypothetical protein